MKKKDSAFFKSVSTIIVVVLVLLGLWNFHTEKAENTNHNIFSNITVSTTNSKINDESTSMMWSDSDIPYKVINNNKPAFDKSEITTKAFEQYSEKDTLGRCGVAFACIGKETMPTEKRGAIGMVKPSGWHTIRYNGVVEGNYLYNRCHLIAFELSGENANEENLITGTRYMNVQGMLPFENKVAEYVRKTGNHVMYRVTPNFEGVNLLASSVQIEAYSVEDKGKGISFNVLCPNYQPRILINYINGESELIN